MTGDADIVVSPAWLSAHLEEVRVVDVRDAWEYGSIGHVPGAANVPFEAFRDAGGGDEGMLPGAERFAEIMGGAGISPDDAVVAYDDEHGVFAARFVVTALMYGHRRVSLLDGDYSAWTRDHPTSTEEPPVEPASYPARVPDDRPLIGADAVRRAVEEGAVLVDTRTPEEFREGHIEGAVNFDWRDLVDPGTRGLKPRSELEGILESYGVTPDRRVVLYCNTARRISHTYVVLKHLGYDRVDFYEGSLTDWNDRGYDLVTGEA